MQEFNETANRVLDAAEYFTQTRGFNAFSYKDIQQEVGIKTSSIHYYFPSKQDLAASMTDRYIQRFRLALGELASDHDNGLDQLKALSDLYGSVLNDGKFCMCGMLASDLLALPDAVNEQLNDFFTMVEQWISQAIILGQTQNLIKPGIDPGTGAAHFLSALEGGMLISRTQAGTDYLQKVMTDVIQHLSL